MKAWQEKIGLNSFAKIATYILASLFALTVTHPAISVPITSPEAASPPISLKLLLKVKNKTISQALYDLDMLDGKLDDDHIVHSIDKLDKYESMEDIQTIKFYKRGGQLLKSITFRRHENGRVRSFVNVTDSGQFVLVGDWFFIKSDGPDGGYDDWHWIYYDHTGKLLWDYDVPGGFHGPTQQIGMSPSGEIIYEHGEIVQPLSPELEYKIMDYNKKLLFKHDFNESNADYGWAPPPDPLFSPDETKIVWLIPYENLHDRNSYINRIYAYTARGKFLFKKEFAAKAPIDKANVSVSNKFVRVSYWDNLKQKSVFREIKWDGSETEGLENMPAAEDISNFSGGREGKAYFYDKGEFEVFPAGLTKDQLGFEQPITNQATDLNIKYGLVILEGLNSKKPPKIYLIGVDMKPRFVVNIGDLFNVKEGDIQGDLRIILNRAGFKKLFLADFRLNTIDSHHRLIKTINKKAYFEVIEK